MTKRRTLGTTLHQLTLKRRNSRRKPSRKSRHSLPSRKSRSKGSQFSRVGIRGLKRLLALLRNSWLLRKTSSQSANGEIRISLSSRREPSHLPASSKKKENKSHWENMLRN